MAPAASKRGRGGSGSGRATGNGKVGNRRPPTVRVSARTGKPVRKYTRREPADRPPLSSAVLGRGIPIVDPAAVMPSDFIGRPPVFGATCDIYTAALDVMKAACTGVGGVFREADARACVRAVRALIAEVQQATPEPQQQPQAQGGSAAATGQTSAANTAPVIAGGVEPWDDDL